MKIIPLKLKKLLNENENKNENENENEQLKYLMIY
tara:strand:+ start:400 stop:504 length:105 start_codon:yes stop_codon:yes gene_type:complete